MSRIASAFVEIRPEAPSFRAEANRAIRDALAAVRASVPLIADGSALRNDVRRAAATATAGTKASVPVSADSSGLRSEVRRAAAESTAGVRANIGLVVEGTVGLARGIRAAVRDASAGQNVDVPVSAESRGLRGEVSRAAGVAGAGQRIDIPINLDSSRFASLDTFFGSISGGIGEISALGSVMQALKFGEVASGALLAASGLLAIGTAAVELVSSLSSVIGVAGALPGLLAAAGQGFGVLKLATSGIGSALKAYASQQDSAGTSAASAASAARSAARAQETAAFEVESATDRLAKAQEQVGVNAERSALQVQNASGQVVEAQRRAGESAERSADRVRTAESGLERAERSLADSQLAEVAAQGRLAQARRDASEELENQTLTVERSALTEARARLAIDQARKHQADVAKDAKATALDRRDAALSVKEAEQSLKEVIDRRRDDEEKLNELRAKGVAGSDQVVTAEQAVADSKRATIEAQRGQVDATRELTRAYRDSNQAAIDSQKGIADAVAGLQRTLQEAGRSAADSQKAVQDAAEALQRALTRAGDAASELDAGSASVDKFAAALDKLPASAQAFVRELLTFKPALESLRGAAADNLFPPLIVGLEKIKGLLPIVTTAVAGTAREIGTLGARFADLVTSPGFKADLATILGRNTTLIGQFGTAGLSLVDAFRNITVVAGPMTERLTGLAVKLADNFRASVDLGRETGTLATFFDHAASTFERVVSIGGSVYDVFKNIGRAALPFGDNLLAGLDSGLQRLSDLTGSISGQSSLTGFFESVQPLLRSIGGLFVAVVKEGAPFLKLLSGNGSVGQGLITILDAVAGSMGSIGQIIGALGPGVQAVAGGIASLAAAALPSIVGLVQTAVPVISSLVTTLGPVLGQLVATVAPVLGKLLTAVGPVLERIVVALGPALADIVTATAPVAGVIGQFGDVLVGLIPLLSGLLVAVAPVAAELLKLGASFLQSLLPAIKPILPVIQQLGKDLAPVLERLAPVFVQLGESLGGALSAAAPILAALALTGVKLLEAILPLAPPILDLATVFLQHLLPAIEPLLPVLVDFIGKIVQGLLPVLPELAPILTKMADTFGQVLLALLPVLPPLADLLVAVIPLLPALLRMNTLFLQSSPLLVPLIRLFADLAAGIVDLAIPALRFFSDKFLDFVGIFVNGAARAFGVIPGIGGKLREAAKDFNQFHEDVNASLDGIKDKTVDLTLVYNKQLSTEQVAANTSQFDRGTGFAFGGTVPGTGSGDTVPAWLTPGEFVVRKSAVQAVGVDALQELNARGYATGGLVVNTSLPSASGIGDSARGLLDELAAQAISEARAQLAKQVAAAASSGAGGGSTGSIGGGEIGTGWRAITEWLDGKNEPYTVTSTTGGQHAEGSLHYAGKAVDMVSDNMLHLFDKLLEVGSSLQELFFDPAGFSIKNGSRADFTIGGHDDHVHAATFDSGGTLGPGLNLVRNATGAPETLVPVGGDGAGIDYDRLAAAVVRAAQASPAVLVVDGKEFARVTAPAMAGEFTRIKDSRR